MPRLRNSQDIEVAPLRRVPPVRRTFRPPLPMDKQLCGGPKPQLLLDLPTFASKRAPAQPDHVHLGNCPASNARTRVPVALLHQKIIRLVGGITDAVCCVSVDRFCGVNDWVVFGAGVCFVDGVVWQLLCRQDFYRKVWEVGLGCGGCRSRPAKSAVLRH